MKMKMDAQERRKDILEKCQVVLTQQFFFFFFFFMQATKVQQENFVFIPNVHID